MDLIKASRRRPASRSIVNYRLTCGFSAPPRRICAEIGQAAARCRDAARATRFAIRSRARSILHATVRAPGALLEAKSARSGGLADLRRSRSRVERATPTTNSATRVVVRAGRSSLRAPRARRCRGRRGRWRRNAARWLRRRRTAGRRPARRARRGRRRGRAARASRSRARADRAPRRDCASGRSLLAIIVAEQRHQFVDRLRCASAPWPSSIRSRAKRPPKKQLITGRPSGRRS